MQELTNNQLYDRMNEIKKSLGHMKSADLLQYTCFVQNFQATQLCRELRRRAEADKDFESTIPSELLPVVFPERFKGLH